MGFFVRYFLSGKAQPEVPVSKEPFVGETVILGKKKYKIEKVVQDKVFAGAILKWDVYLA